MQTAVICTQECFGDCQRVGRRHGLLAYVQSPDKKDAHMSSFSATSAPMRSRVQAQAQMVLSGSWWISRRGKCAGSAWRLGLLLLTLRRRHGRKLFQLTLHCCQVGVDGLPAGSSARD